MRRQCSCDALPGPTIEEDDVSRAEAATASVEAVNRYMKTQDHLAPEARRWRRSLIVKFVTSLDERSIASATPGDVEAWLDQRPLSSHTRRRRRGALSAFFTWAVENQIVSLHPAPPRRARSRSSWGRIAAGSTVSEAGGESSLEVLALTYVSLRVRRGDMTRVTACNTLVTLHTFADGYGRRSLDDLGPEHIEEWLQGMRHLAPNSKRTELARLKPFLRWLARRGHLAWDPGPEIAPIKVPKRLPRHLTLSDVAALLAACPDSRARLIVLCQVQLGLRSCEVALLRLEDVSFADRTLRVRGKGGHERLLPIDDETWCALADYLRERRGGGGPLIRPSVRRLDAHLSAGRISDVVRDCMLAAKIKHGARDGISAHSLRHTACIDMLRRGAHLRDVQTVMGHSKLETTAWYLPMVVHGLREAMGGRWYGPPAVEGDHQGLDLNPFQLSLPGFPPCNVGMKPPQAHPNHDRPLVAPVEADVAAPSLAPSGRL